MKEHCTGDDTHTAISRFWVGNFQIIWMSTGQKEILCQCPFYCLMCRRWPRDSAETCLCLWYSSWGVWKHQTQLCCRVIIPRNSRSGTAHWDYVPLYLFPVVVSPHFLLRRAFWFPEDNYRTSPNRRTSPATSLITLLCNIWATLARDKFPTTSKSQND